MLKHRQSLFTLLSMHKYNKCAFSANRIPVQTTFKARAKRSSLFHARDVCTVNGTLNSENDTLTIFSDDPTRFERAQARYDEKDLAFSKINLDSISFSISNYNERPVLFYNGKLGIDHIVPWALVLSSNTNERGNADTYENVLEKEATYDITIEFLSPNQESEVHKNYGIIVGDDNGEVLVHNYIRWLSEIQNKYMDFVINNKSKFALIADYEDDEIKTFFTRIFRSEDDRSSITFKKKVLDFYGNRNKVTAFDSQGKSYDGYKTLSEGSFVSVHSIVKPYLFQPPGKKKPIIGISKSLENFQYLY